MTPADLLRERLRSQHLSGPPLDTPEEAVRWLGAVQAQDYGAAKWALAQRVRGATDADLDRAFASGAFLRTHVMRPTWHFVMPSDIRWLLKLTAPRVNAVSAYYYRKWELDEQVFAKTEAALVKALRGGRHLTRAALAAALERARILRPGRDPLRLGGLLMRAELDAVICSGPRQGKQFTYALLEERVPRATVLSHEDARAELARRYFSSHGPATLEDFMWWSGLSRADARAGLDAVASGLSREAVNSRVYWRTPARRTVKKASTTAYLIPVYDEVFLSYRELRERSTPHMAQVIRDNGQMIVIDGRSVGTWRRTIKRNRAIVHASPFVELTGREANAIEEAADRYGRFLNVPASVEFRRT
jgi:hypothetical protein